MCLEEMQGCLEEEYGYDVWTDCLQNKMKDVVIHTLESVQDMFEKHKGQQHELFGYDIMVDEELNCWLIEVNSSPAMDYSTQVTERLVKMVLEDTIKVVVDYNGCRTEKKKARTDTGLWEQIYKSKRMVDKPMGSFGLTLECRGKQIPEENLKLY